jgi:Ca2+-transporting ATPase
MAAAKLDMLPGENIAALHPFPNVFARVSPDNKLAIVQALQGSGSHVIKKGDGINRAPAIKAAKVGVAMGIAGTEITKLAADVA